MATARQIEANRKNAQKSTGPKTAKGKQVASRNATRHGLFGRDIAHDNEDPAVFDALVDDLRADLNPGSVLEDELVDQLAMAFWRNRRLAKAERDQLNEEDVFMGKPAGFMPLNTRLLYARYQTMITNEVRKTLAMFYEARERRISALEAVSNDRGEGDAS